MKALWNITKILLTVAGSIGILLIQGYEDKEEIKPIQCKYTGMDKIEYGVWVTNCGDTVHIEEKADRLRKYDSIHGIKSSVEKW